MGPAPSRTSTAASVIVVAFDSEATLGSCLESLTPQVAEVGADLIVVDNASTDASASIAEAHGAAIVRSERNLGFAGGCNLGARHGAGATIVLVNPDTDLAPRALAHLVGAASAPGSGPVGGRAEHADGSFDPRCALGRPSLRGAMLFALGIDAMFRGSASLDPEYGPTEVAADAGLHPVEAVSGAVMAIPRDLWETLGGLDEGYFVYGEDVDLCLRSSRLGRPATIATSARYRHVGGMVADDSPGRRILLYRGKVELYRRHLQAPAAALAVASLQLGTFLRGVPAKIGLGPQGRSQPWRRLFEERRSWRDGHLGPTEMARS